LGHTGPQAHPHIHKILSHALAYSATLMVEATGFFDGNDLPDRMASHPRIQ
jgi:hypothetical protein